MAIGPTRNRGSTRMNADRSSRRLARAASTGGFTLVKGHASVSLVRSHLCSSAFICGFISNAVALTGFPPSRTHSPPNPLRRPGVPAQTTIAPPAPSGPPPAVSTPAPRSPPPPRPPPAKGSATWSHAPRCGAAAPLRDDRRDAAAPSTTPRSLGPSSPRAPPAAAQTRSSPAVPDNRRSGRCARSTSTSTDKRYADAPPARTTTRITPRPAACFPAAVRHRVQLHRHPPTQMPQRARRRELPPTPRWASTAPPPSAHPAARSPPDRSGGPAAKRRTPPSNTRRNALRELRGRTAQPPPRPAAAHHAAAETPARPQAVDHRPDALQILPAREHHQRVGLDLRRDARRSGALRGAPSAARTGFQRRFPLAAGAPRSRSRASSRRSSCSSGDRNPSFSDRAARCAHRREQRDHHERCFDVRTPRAQRAEQPLHLLEDRLVAR